MRQSWRQTPSGHIGTVLGPTDHVWRRWVENPYAFYYTPLGIATVLLVVLPGHGWREQVTGGVALTSALAVIHDAYLVVLLMLVMHFFVALPVGWSVLLTILIAFPTGRLYDTHGAIPDAAAEITSVLFLRVPVMVMFGIVVRTAAAQNEERRRLLDTLAAAERRAGLLEERQRLAGEIHDTLAQGFAAIVVHRHRSNLRRDSSSVQRTRTSVTRTDSASPRPSTVNPQTPTPYPGRSNSASSSGAQSIRP